MDKQKIEQFKKDVEDEKGMTARQEAATKYAARQVMAYLSDVLYDGKGLSERGTGSGDESDKRRIFTTDGMWTSRFRREWGLFFDPHEARSHGLHAEEQQERREKDRGDHRHHPIDAVITALCTRQVQIAWEEREKLADRDGVNTADGEAMENYRRQHPLKPPAPFKTREEFREVVKRAVFGREAASKPVCHRPVKRKLIGPLHRETMYGPVLRSDGSRDPRVVTVRMKVADLSPAYLRVPAGWDDLSAKLSDSTCPKSKRSALRRQLAALVDPAPGPGLVRDRTTRDYLRRHFASKGLSLGTPDAANYRVKGGFTDRDLRKVLRPDGSLPLSSGVPVRTVVVLRAFSEPVVIQRRRWNCARSGMENDCDPRSLRIYESQNNHHIEIRVDDKGKWSSEVVSAFKAAERKLAGLRAMREAGIPKPNEFRRLSRTERRKYTPILRRIEQAHPIVDRRDDEARGGRFVMSLCEGEMLWMRRKPEKRGQPPGAAGYFVVAKMSEGEGIVLVPHWDARSATGRKDAEGRKVPNSKREQFAVTPSHLKALAPPGHEHAVKVRIGPLGDVHVLDRD